MPVCKNTSEKRYTGKENTPLGRGYSASAEEEGKRMKGRNGKMYVAHGERWSVISENEKSPRGKWLDKLMGKKKEPEGPSIEEIEREEIEREEMRHDQKLEREREEREKEREAQFERDQEYGRYQRGEEHEYDAVSDLPPEMDQMIQTWATSCKQLAGFAHANKKSRASFKERLPQLWEGMQRIKPYLPDLDFSNGVDDNTVENALATCHLLEKCEKDYAREFNRFTDDQKSKLLFMRSKGLTCAVVRGAILAGTEISWEDIHWISDLIDAGDKPWFANQIISHHLKTDEQRHLYRSYLTDNYDINELLRDAIKMKDYDLPPEIREDVLRYIAEGQGISDAIHRANLERMAEKRRLREEEYAALRRELNY